MIVGSFALVWAEDRYLGPVLEQIQLCPGPKVVVWQDQPLYWLGEGSPLSGHNSKVKDVLAEFPDIPVIKVERAPSVDQFGGFLSLIDSTFQWLIERGAENMVIMDSDWLMTKADTARFYDGIQEPAMYYETDARHYWRDWNTLYADTPIHSVYPKEFPNIHVSPRPCPTKKIPGVMCYHPSYVLTDEEMYRKVNSWGHAPLFKERGFYEKEWLPKNDSIVNPWPTDVQLPDELKQTLIKWGALI